MPTAASSMTEWWSLIQLEGRARKDLATIVTLFSWTLWKHRNGIVFDKKVPNHARGLAEVVAEWKILALAKLFSENNVFNLPLDVVSGEMWRDMG